MLLMLAESINEIGGYLFNTNTDGVYIKINKSKLPQLADIKK